MSMQFLAASTFADKQSDHNYSAIFKTTYIPQTDRTTRFHNFFNLAYALNKYSYKT